ncbi:MAG: TolC family protein, partial [Cytophagales bacterium]
MKPISMALLSALIWLFSQAAFAQQTNSNFDLNECLKYALEHSVTIKNSLLSQSSAEARVQEIKSIGLPQANANINLASNLLVPRSFIPAEFSGGPPGTFQAVAFQPQYTGQAGVDVSQLVFDGAYFLGLKAASVFTKISEKTVVMDKITVVENVSKAYYTVLINQERLKLLQKNYSRMDSLYYQTKMLFQNGFAEKLDVSRLEVSLNNLKAEIQK